MSTLNQEKQLTRAERERRAYDEENLWESSHRWHSRFPHVFQSPNSVRYEQMFDRFLAQASKGKRALEIGCADGLTAEKVYSLGAQFVLGIDISENFIKKAKEREKRGKLEFRVG
ncbi:MAG: class I SAM-dependent methyltransferase [Ignavibacteriales bacterium]|nr:class I SAM-dependent methyltransferase [Ignavibacteriales bacterium]